MIQILDELLPIGVFHGVIWGGFALCVILFICRMGIRVSCFGRPFVEDYLMFASLVLFLASTIISQVFLQYLYQAEEWLYGMGTISATHETAAKASAGLSSVMYINYVGIWLVKLNFMLFFRRLGNHVFKYRATWWIVLLYNSIAGVGCIVSLALACFGIPYTDGEVNTCGFFTSAERENLATIVVVVIDVIGDALIMAFPTWILWGTRVSARKKLVLSAIFGLVTITIVTTIIRVTKYGGFHAGYLYVVWFWFWLSIEFIAAFMVGCLISFRSLFTHREKAARELEAQIRREAAQQPATKEPTGFRARARLLQQDLLTTFTAWEDTRVMGEGGRFLNSYCPPSGRLSLDFQQDNVGGEAATPP
ncbi:hypothetical protein PG991_005553 [Apiospora marii]|uniref:Rhodopsin domain-containing protein n=1 Tax=Apiospora marii TaxID=335849 RepID=A0ABR1SBQ4_9PEZI